MTALSTAGGGYKLTVQPTGAGAEIEIGDAAGGSDFRASLSCGDVAFTSVTLGGEDYVLAVTVPIQDSNAGFESFLSSAAQYVAVADGLTTQMNSPMVGSPAKTTYVVK